MALLFLHQVQYLFVAGPILVLRLEQVDGGLTGSFGLLEYRLYFSRAFRRSRQFMAELLAGLTRIFGRGALA